MVDAYQEALLGLLGSGDPLDVLAETPSWCTAVLEQSAPGTLHEPEAPRKWSVASVLHHLADSEIMFSYRLRRVLAEDRPVLEGFDQDLWAARLSYDARDPSLSAELFDVTRRANLELLALAAEADRMRVGLHGERGEESVQRMMCLYAGHDLAHRRQIERILG